MKRDLSSFCVSFAQQVSKAKSQAGENFNKAKESAKQGAKGAADYIQGATTQATEKD